MPVLSRKPRTPREAREIEADLDERLDQRLFKALADSNRLLLFSCLVKVGRPATASELAACCAVEFSVANKHLKLLVGAKLLRSAKRGREVWYEARCGDLCDRLAKLIEAIVIWCPNLSSDAAPTSPSRGCCGAEREV